MVVSAFKESACLSCHEGFAVVNIYLRGTGGAVYYIWFPALKRGVITGYLFESFVDWRYLNVLFFRDVSLFR